MNILVVDDDPLAQRIMKMFVERSGYTPIIYSDGQKGLDAALAPDTPAIVLLDWMLPGMDGLAVCRKLREARPRVRPYIIMLSSKQGKDEIAAGLDAGADDFVSKPFNVGEMQARLRVGQRIVEYQRELIKQIDDNEALTQRNSLLAELISKRQGGQQALPTLPVHKPAERKPTDFTDHEVRYMLSVALLELRLALQAVTPRKKAPGFGRAEHSAWSGLLLPQQDLWMDLVLTADNAAADQLFERSLGRKPGSDTETAGFMAEMTRMVAIGFTRMLQVRAGEVVQPIMPRALRIWNPASPVPLAEDCRSYDLVVENQTLRIAIDREPCPKRQLAPGAVRELDVLAMPFPPREISEVPMFKEGVVLTPRFIEKIVTHDVAMQQGDCVSVRRPTKLARYFNGT